MRLLVTRPEEDAARTAVELEARGHQAILAPLMTIRIHSGPPLALGGVQALIVTSANGLRALASRTARRDLPVFAVGAQSAEAATAAGFDDVRHAGGDAAALATAISGWADPRAGALFHAAAAQTRGDLAAILTAAGFILRQDVLYEAIAAEVLPDEAAAALSAGSADGVLLYSPRSAALFAAAVRRIGLAAACSGLTAYCLSEATADGLGDLAVRRRVIAARPDQAAMLALL